MEVVYVIHDAWRLGLTGDYILADSEYHYHSSFVSLRLSGVLSSVGTAANTDPYYSTVWELL